MLDAAGQTRSATLASRPSPLGIFPRVMNSCAFTGWLPREFEIRSSKSGAPILYFQAVVKDADGEEELLHFHTTDAALIEKCRPWLTKGRVVIVARSQVCKAWHPQSGFGSVFGFRVFELEIPDRSKPAREDAAAAKEERVA